MPFAIAIASTILAQIRAILYARESIVDSLRSKVHNAKSCGEAKEREVVSSWTRFAKDEARSLYRPGYAGAPTIGAGMWDCLKRLVFARSAIPMGAHYRCPQGVRSRGEEFCQGKYLSGVSGIVYKQIGADGNAIVSDRYIAARPSEKPWLLGFTCPAEGRFLSEKFSSVRAVSRVRKRRRVSP